MIYSGTGHRPNKLLVEGEPAYPETYAFERLCALAGHALKNAKDIEGIISGGALGWDMALADAGLELNIPVTIAVPFVGQERMWPESSQDYYIGLLAAAHKVVTLSREGYSARRMQERNMWMVDNSDHVLALWNGSSGGTGNCMNYAISKNKPYTNFWDLWEKYK